MVEVVGLELVVAAPGPSPNAGTLPVCLVVAIIELLFCEGEGRDGLLDGSGTEADVNAENEDATAVRDCLVCVIKVLGSIVAAPGPSPNAGTLPICFEIVSEDDVEADSAWMGNVGFWDCKEELEI